MQLERSRKDDEATNWSHTAKLQNGYLWWPDLRVSSNNLVKFFIKRLIWIETLLYVRVLQHCIGAIDGTHVTTRVPKS
jgi:hypothetical protein